MSNRTYRYFKGQPLFPFGHGLSYTTFALGKPSYKNGKVCVSVKNTGSREGTEVVQVYVRNPRDVEGPQKTLRAYKRVNLKPGETQMVEIDLPRERFELWDTKSNTMRVVPGKHQIMVGTSSADDNLQTIVANIK
jgi:beta-glucosidase